MVSGDARIHGWRFNLAVGGKYSLYTSYTRAWTARNYGSI
jgi:hypothetical protein